MTPDVAGAKAFYSRLFGWDLEDMPMQDTTYTVNRAGGWEIGGMMATPPEAQGTPPIWGTYVTVDDVDDTARTAADLGAAVVVAPRDIPGVGRFCVIRDPQGAFITTITYQAAR